MCGCSLPEYQILFDLCWQFKPDRILEIGSGFGVSSLVLLESCDAQIIQVDPAETGNIRKIFFQTDDDLGQLFHMQMKSMEFWRKTDGDFDFIWIDGSHHPVDSEVDVRRSSQRIREGGIIAVHDIAHPGSEYIADWCTKVAEETGKRCTLLKNTDGHGMGLIY